MTLGDEDWDCQSPEPGEHSARIIPKAFRCSGMNPFLFERHARFEEAGMENCGQVREWMQVFGSCLWSIPDTMGELRLVLRDAGRRIKSPSLSTVTVKPSCRHRKQAWAW
jgi:hypothetical protein